MNAAAAPDADPEAELAEAKRRLAEAEATLEAIRMGKVDALIVSGNDSEEEVRAILNMGSLANLVFNQVAQPVFILDAAGRIQRLNHAASALAGENAEGRPFGEALPLRPAGLEGHGMPSDWIGRRTHIAALEVESEHPRTGKRFYLLDANPIDSGWHGAPGGIVTLLDITARKQAETALRLSLEKQQHSQKMEAVGRLAGGIAHDFNNLLLAILGFTDLCLVQVPEGSQVHENLREVKRAGDRAAALTAQLLAYGRKQMLDPKVHDLNDAVHDLLKMLGRLIGETIRLEVAQSPEKLPARFDQAKFQQVLMNITLNARDAMPRGGGLFLRTGRAEFRDADLSGMVRETRRECEDGVPPGEFVYAEIEDTGHGMGPDVLDHLFEPFFTTKEFGKGSGLGLSTAYGIVKQMGGYVQVFSAPGRGSRFRVLFPLAREGGLARLPDAPAGKPGPRRAAGERILLAEDEPMVRKLLAKVLRDQGYEVIEAEDGEVALARLPGPGETPLSLVITDIVMDRMGGIELARRLAVLRPGLDVLFISGYAEDQHRLPIDGPERPLFAAKPFRPADFLEQVRGILERKAQAA